VDEVTQWEVVSATAQISEAALKPVLEALFRQFPFRILGFHSDNGSEFINHVVAELLNKLLIAQTKSRPRHCNDNALVECKNGAVIRKHIGYGYIAAEHAPAMQSFYLQYFNPYLNFHRPCGVPEAVINAQGKERKRYRWYATPWEILRRLPGVAGYLKGDLTIPEMEGWARRQTDMQAATAMQAPNGSCSGGFIAPTIANRTISCTCTCLAPHAGYRNREAEKCPWPWRSNVRLGLAVVLLDIALDGLLHPCPADRR